MAERRPLSAGVYAGLKATTRLFVDRAFGHQKVAAAATRVEQQAISDYGSTLPEKAERFMPIDVLLDLTRASGNTTLLKYLADECGCLLVPLPHGDGHGPLTDHSARTAQEFGEVMAGILSALADRRITPGEAAGVLTNIHELMLELAALAEAVKVATEGDEE